MHGQRDLGAEEHGNGNEDNEGNEGNPNEGSGITYGLGLPSGSTGSGGSSTGSNNSVTSVQTSQGIVTVNNSGHTEIVTASGTVINFVFDPDLATSTRALMVSTAVNYANAVGDGSLHAQRKPAELTVQVTDFGITKFEGAYHAGHVAVETHVGDKNKKVSGAEMASTLVHELTHAYNDELHETTSGNDNPAEPEKSHHAYVFQEQVDHAGGVIGVDATSSGTKQPAADPNRGHWNPQIMQTVVDQSNKPLVPIGHGLNVDLDSPHVHYSLFSNEFLGGNGSDNLTGTAEIDYLFGYGGDDVIFGYAENDVLYGNDGNDILHGGAGHDILRGGKGDDILNGNSDHDYIYGGEGADTLRGGDGDDVLGSGPIDFLRAA